jgi:DNA-binding CsgD family transcriptional regulator
MIINNKSLDVSEEFFISRYRNGVKLIPPTNIRSLPYTVKSTQELPFCIYFLAPNSVLRYINEKEAETLGFASVSEGVGKSAFDVCPTDNALTFIKTDQDVVKNNTARIVEEALIRNDGIKSNHLSIKVPCYDSEDNIAGIFGCSILLNGQPYVAECLLHITKLGLLNGLALATNNHTDFNLLSTRQRDCLYYLAKGMTLKEIGTILNLSPRTIGHYLEAVKVKLGCFSRSQLVEKALTIGIPN